MVGEAAGAARRELVDEGGRTSPLALLGRDFARRLLVEDGGAGVGRASLAPADKRLVGMANRNVEPCPGVDSTSMKPLCSSTSFLLT